MGVIDHHQHAVVLDEDGPAGAARQAVVPESAIAHDADRALAGFARLEGGRAGRRPRPYPMVAAASTISGNVYN